MTIPTNGAGFLGFQNAWLTPHGSNLYYSECTSMIQRRFHHAVPPKRLPVERLCANNIDSTTKALPAKCYWETMTR